MSLDKDLINKLVKVTSRAAINCYQFLGKGNKKIADKAATDTLRKEINKLDILTLTPLDAFQKLHKLKSFINLQ